MFESREHFATNRRQGDEFERQVILACNEACFPGDLALPRKAGKLDAIINHMGNFFDCVKSRARTACHQDVMRRSHIACFAAELAWELGRKVTFDPVAEGAEADVRQVVVEGSRLYAASAADGVGSEA